MDDVALVARARVGDFSALGQLLGAHQSGAYTAALRLVGNAADAEDITQDALVRAYTHISDLEDDASFGAWLRRIAVNLSLNLLRRRGLLRFESLDDADGGPAALDFVDEMQRTPEEAALSADLCDAIERLVRELPDEQRVAVVLRDMYGYDVAEVAELQRCKLSAAKMRIMRGRAALRRLLTEARLEPMNRES